MPPLPSSLTGTLIAVTFALAILALFFTAITIRRTLSSYVVAHRRGHVVALLTPSQRWEKVRLMSLSSRVYFCP
jgi:hypothetical protein